ncbi:DUF4123 domain-containing protein [Pseudomonas purpurea]
MTISVLLERTDDLLEKIYRHLEDPNLSLLFDTTELALYADQSPLWLETPTHSAFLEAIRNEPVNWPGLIIESEADAQTLLTHLRHILLVRFGQGRKGVLRYSHPTTASYLFPVDDVQAGPTWMGPISCLTWYGGTWSDLALGGQRWISIDNPKALQWKAVENMTPVHLSAPYEQALQRQQKEHFLYQWWEKHDTTPYPQAEKYLQDGMSSGFAQAAELNEYLSLRAHHPSQDAPHVPPHGTSEDRLEQMRLHLERNQQDKESLT